VSRGAIVYKLTTDEGFEWLVPTEERDFDLLRFDGSSHKRKWQPVSMRRLKFSDKGKSLIPCDFPASASDLILSSRARDKIGEYLEQYGELLPLACEDGEFWAYNVTTIVDALDSEATQAVRASVGGRILMIIRHIFKIDMLVDVGLFKLPQTRKGLIYSTADFAEKLRAFDLVGLKLVQVWAPN
jgi:hypothetical protein